MRVRLFEIQGRVGYSRVGYNVGYYCTRKGEMQTGLIVILKIHTCRFSDSMCCVSESVAGDKTAKRRLVRSHGREDESLMIQVALF